MLNIIEITDFQSPDLDVYARMSEAQLLNRAEPDKGIFIAESPKVIERALNKGYKPVSLLMEKKHLSTEAIPILERIEHLDAKIPVYVGEFELLTQLTGFRLTRGMLCAMHRPPLLTIDEVCRDSRTLVILQNVMNPTNVGAIFRSAAALNIDGILVTNDSSNPLYRRAIRVSMGCVFQIPWTIITENPQDYLHKKGFKTVAMALRKNTININDNTLLSEPRLAIYMGSEGDGLPEDILDSCDYTVRIPMSHNVDSLNVAAASAVAFWELGSRF